LLARLASDVELFQDVDEFTDRHEPDRVLEALFSRERRGLVGRDELVVVGLHHVRDVFAKLGVVDATSLERRDDVLDARREPVQLLRLVLVQHVRRDRSEVVRLLDELDGLGAVEEARQFERVVLDLEKAVLVLLADVADLATAVLVPNLVDRRGLEVAFVLFVVGLVVAILRRRAVDESIGDVLPEKTFSLIAVDVLFIGDPRDLRPLLGVAEINAFPSPRIAADEFGFLVLGGFGFGVFRSRHARVHALGREFSHLGVVLDARHSPSRKEGIERCRAHRLVVGLVAIDVGVQQELETALPGESSRFPQRVFVLEAPVDDGSGYGRIERWQQRFGVREKDVEGDFVALLARVNLQDAVAFLAKILLALLRSSDFVDPVADGAGCRHSFYFNSGRR
jgi:hypothetical protein